MASQAKVVTFRRCLAFISSLAAVVATLTLVSELSDVAFYQSSGVPRVKALTAPMLASNARAHDSSMAPVDSSNAPPVIHKDDDNDDDDDDDDGGGGGGSSGGGSLDEPESRVPTPLDLEEPESRASTPPEPDRGIAGGDDAPGPNFNALDDWLNGTWGQVEGSGGGVALVSELWLRGGVVTCAKRSYGRI